ncbi:hypothetical protein K7432_006672 [Basidiobolus ranarum]|uniref:polynucleotide adenylyltransferase n=1 Tax=Basidiobolus ranarum TaxID=34480 RepID=A0ABR2W183_9FUNG
MARFPSPKEVEKAISIASSKRQKAIRDYELLSICRELLEDEDMSLQELTFHIRQINKSLIPEKGLASYLRRPEVSPYFILQYNPFMSQWWVYLVNDSIDIGSLYPDPIVESDFDYRIGRDYDNGFETKIPNPRRYWTLSTYLIRYFQRSIPSSEQVSRVTNAARSIMRNTVDAVWNRYRMDFVVFGSTLTNLALYTSDIDISINTGLNSRDKQLATLKLLKNVIMKTRQPTKCVIYSRAKVPVLKYFEPKISRQIDISINNMQALRKTQFLQIYGTLDYRVRPLLLLIKLWAARREINDATSGTLNSFCYTMMMITFLHIRGVIPCLQAICCLGVDEEEDLADRLQRMNICSFNPECDPSECLNCGKPLPEILIEGQNYYFYKDFKRLPQSRNDQSIGELFAGFFEYFAFQFSYESQLLDTARGRIVYRCCKCMQYDENAKTPLSNLLVVLDPFQHSRNIAGSARPWAVKGIRWEFARAWRLLQRCNVNGLFTPYTPLSLVDIRNIYHTAPSGSISSCPRCTLV